jgi:hypothetical protein
LLSWLQLSTKKVALSKMKSDRARVIRRRFSKTTTCGGQRTKPHWRMIKGNPAHKGNTNWDRSGWFDCSDSPIGDEQNVLAKEFLFIGNPWKRRRKRKAAVSLDPGNVASRIGWIDIFWV